MSRQVALCGEERKLVAQQRGGDEPPDTEGLAPQRRDRAGHPPARGGHLGGAQRWRVGATPVPALLALGEGCRRVAAAAGLRLPGSSGPRPGRARRLCRRPLRLCARGGRPGGASGLPTSAAAEPLALPRGRPALVDRPHPLQGGEGRQGHSAQRRRPTWHPPRRSQRMARADGPDLGGVQVREAAGYHGRLLRTGPVGTGPPRRSLAAALGQGRLPRHVRRLGRQRQRRHGAPGVSVQGRPRRVALRGDGRALVAVGHIMQGPAQSRRLATQ
mmetsp:Transcript_109533/g.342725  ORF Transcript_109533/g.342725 Transcript_109533/m.342725 type:complete len:273 (-) Transcript_109533:800-1618(-)